MEYRATSKYIRVAPRKVRLVARELAGLSPRVAIELLGKSTKRATSPLVSVIESAMAAAKFRGVDVSQLTFRSIDVMQGPSMKRWQAVSRGMAHGYKKRMTHIRVVLTDENKESKSIRNDGGKNT